MPIFSSLYNTPDKLKSPAGLSGDMRDKVEASLVEHVYSQLIVATTASLFCATIVFLGLCEPHFDNGLLCLWGGFFVLVAVLRLCTLFLYYRSAHKISSSVFWGNVYMAGCFLGGVAWGVIAFLFFPFVGFAKQILVVLMLAGISAGSVPLSAAIPKAGIAFLITSVLPLFIAIIAFKDPTYYLFSAAIIVYMAYTIAVTFKTHRLILNAIILKYENDLLLNNLSISNRLLQTAATHDPLTNVSNRRLFETTLEEALRRAEGKKKKVALFYIDLDHFKEVNDKWGHKAGDLILKTVTERLSSYFRKRDIVARLGGDELAVIVENFDNRKDLRAMGTKICQIVALPIEMKDAVLNISASVGIGLYPEDGSTTEDLVAVADRCMYYVKGRGGNGFHSRSGLEAVESQE